MGVSHLLLFFCFALSMDVLDQRHLVPMSSSSADLLYYPAQFFEDGRLDMYESPQRETGKSIFYLTRKGDPEDHIALKFEKFPPNVPHEKVGEFFLKMASFYDKLTNGFLQVRVLPLDDVIETNPGLYKNYKDGTQYFAFVMSQAINLQLNEEGVIEAARKSKSIAKNFGTIVACDFFLGNDDRLQATFAMWNNLFLACTGNGKKCQVVAVDFWPGDHGPLVNFDEFDPALLEWTEFAPYLTAKTVEKCTALWKPVFGKVPKGFCKGFIQARDYLVELGLQDNAPGIKNRAQWIKDIVSPGLGIQPDVVGFGMLGASRGLGDYWNSLRSSKSKKIKDDEVKEIIN